MASTGTTFRMSLDEYLAFEAAAEVRHEFRDDLVTCVQGGTYQHSLIIVGIGSLIHSQLKGTKCIGLSSGMRLRIGERPRFYYPDVTVVCGDPRFDRASPSQTTLLNPRVVVEVLSDWSEAFERGQKFADYREIESLQEYVLVSQDEPEVQVYSRQGDGCWLFDPVAGLDATVRLRSVDIELPLSEVYAGVAFARNDPDAVESPSERINPS